MLVVFIKYFIINVVFIFSYVKLINIKKISNIFTTITLILYSLVVSTAYFIFPASISVAYIILVPIISFPLMKKLFGSKMSYSFSTSVIAYAISYGCFTISTFVVVLFFVLFFKQYLQNDLVIQPFLSAFQMLLCYFIFKIKRFKLGMPFLKDEKYNFPGLCISFILIIGVVLMKNTTSNLVYTIPTIFILLSIILIYIWWKARLQATYIEMINKRKIDFLNNEINILKKDNENLSTLVHKDNKIIPALELSVKQYISSQVIDENTTKDLLNNIDTISKERIGIINKCITVNQVLPTTKIISIDSLMNYMYVKASDAGILLSLSNNCTLSDLTKDIISENELNTLLADLIENAIISTTYNCGKNILVNFFLKNNVYQIDVFDHGENFDRDVLLNFGKKRITTHKNFGTGIGLTTIYKICEKKKASIVIDETMRNTLYTKKLSVKFDNLFEYTLITNREANDIKYLSARNNLVIISG